MGKGNRNRIAKEQEKAQKQKELEKKQRRQRRHQNRHSCAGAVFCRGAHRRNCAGQSVGCRKIPAQHYIGHLRQL